MSDSDTSTELVPAGRDDTPDGGPKDQSNGDVSARTGRDALLNDSVKRGACAERESIRQAYQRGWEHFLEFCKAEDLCPLPAERRVGSCTESEDRKQPTTRRRYKSPTTCPAFGPPNDALREWLDAAGIDSGPLFRMVDRWGNVRDGALSGQSVYETVRGRMEFIGHDPSDYGVYSLRAGFATQAYMDGIGEHEAAMQTRHASLETLWEYQRVHVVMDDHPLSRMGTEKNSAE